jgi:hypothetical protein
MKRGEVNMKKLLVGLGLTASLMMGLAGCSEEASDTKPKEEVKAKAETPKEEPTTPVVETEDTTTDDATARAEYAAYYVPLMTDFATTMGELSGLLTSVSEADLKVRASWYDRVMASVNDMEGQLEEMRSYDGAIPEGVEGAHESLMLAIEEYQHIPDDLPPALDIMYSSGGTSGINEMNAITEHILQGNDYLGEFNTSITELNQQ